MLKTKGEVAASARAQDKSKVGARGCPSLPPRGGGEHAPPRPLREVTVSWLARATSSSRRRQLASSTPGDCPAGHRNHSSSCDMSSSSGQQHARCNIDHPSQFERPATTTGRFFLCISTVRLSVPPLAPLSYLQPALPARPSLVVWGVALPRAFVDTHTPHWKQASTLSARQ